MYRTTCQDRSHQVTGDNHWWVHLQLCTDHTRFANPSSVLAAKQPYSILKKLALNQTIPDILMAMDTGNPVIVTRIGSVGLMEACPHPTDKILSDEEALGNALMVI